MIEEKPEQQTKIIAGIPVHYPKGKRLTTAREEAIERAIISFEEAFDQKLWRVWLAENNGGDGRYYNFSFTFNMKEGL
jgi:hypothetical protein